MYLRRLTAPSLEIVSLARVREHLRVDAQDEDSLIQALIDGAVAHLDGWQGVLGWCLGTQTWQLSLDGFPMSQPILIPLGPLIAVTSVEYLVAGSYVTLAPEAYTVDAIADPARILPVEDWPAPDSAAVRVTFSAGHATAAEIHKAIVPAILLTVAHWYRNREAVAVGTIATEMPTSASALIGALRKVPV